MHSLFQLDNDLRGTTGLLSQMFPLLADIYDSVQTICTVRFVAKHQGCNTLETCKECKCSAAVTL